MIRRPRPAIVRVTVRALSLATVEGGCGPSRRRCPPAATEPYTRCLEQCPQPTDQRTGSAGGRCATD
jgi:hypothetical protein